MSLPQKYFKGGPTRPPKLQQYHPCAFTEPRPSAPYSSKVAVGNLSVNEKSAKGFPLKSPPQATTEVESNEGGA